MQGVFVAILTFSLGTGKCKGDRKPLRNSVLICVRRDFLYVNCFLHPQLCTLSLLMHLSQVEVSP